MVVKLMKKLRKKTIFKRTTILNGNLNINMARYKRQN